ncbi:MAG: alanine/glycine:cation symporter family protein [Planctomycetota bacterium]
MHTITSLFQPRALSLTLALLLGLFAWATPAYAQDEVPSTHNAEAVQASDAEQDPSQPTTDASVPPAAAEEAEEPAPPTISDRLDTVLGTINNAIVGVLFFDVTFGVFGEGKSFPLMVFVLGLGAVFFTFWHGFINIRGFKHALQIVRGKYRSKDDPGDIPPYQALTSALSATVGLGNIAMVAIAIHIGGPGALFWMMFLGVFGMSAKFHESTLAQMFRKKNPDGSISGGPMYYLDQGLTAINPALKPLGKALAVIFCIFCIGGALGGGNMFQANQAYEGFYTAFVGSPSLAEQRRGELPVQDLRALIAEDQLTRISELETEYAEMTPEEVRTALPDTEVRNTVRAEAIETLLPAEEVAKEKQARESLKRNVSYGFGLLIAVLVGFVVLGGITRIASATSKIVPFMCAFYVIGCLIVLGLNVEKIPSHIVEVITGAFQWESAFGGLIVVMVQGLKRAAFSSEAGLGSSAIAHSAAQQSEPVREGFVASLEPFIDTIVICFLTAMVVIVTDAYKAPQFVGTENGAAITMFAFQQTGALASWFPSILSISIILFAFSTMISWCYYGERATAYMFGLKSLLAFRLLFVVCVFVGTVASLGQVILFSDLMLLSMAFPNIIGGIILAPMVKRKVADYWTRYKAGKFDGPQAGPDTTGADI